MFTLSDILMGNRWTFDGAEMSQMREPTTINQNSNSVASLIRSKDASPPTKYSLTSKNDRNNNNVMKKSMPPPIPPKNRARSGNTDAPDKRPGVSSNSGISQSAVINHVHGPLIARGNVLHQLYPLAEKSHSKGQHNCPDNASQSKNSFWFRIKWWEKKRHWWYHWRESHFEQRDIASLWQQYDYSICWIVLRATHFSMRCLNLII